MRTKTTAKLDTDWLIVLEPGLQPAPPKRPLAATAICGEWLRSRLGGGGSGDLRRRKLITLAKSIGSWLSTVLPPTVVVVDRVVVGKDPRRLMRGEDADEGVVDCVVIATATPWVSSTALVKLKAIPTKTLGPSWFAVLG